MNDSLQDQTDRVLLRASDIERWRDEIDKLHNQRNEIDEKIQLLNQKLVAAEFLAEPEITEPPAAEVVPIRIAQETDTAGGVGIHIGDENMPSAVERIILNADKWLWHAQIQGELKKIPEFRKRLEKNPNYYYTIIGRLVTRKKIAKRGSRYGPPPPKHENAKDSDHA